jgi:BirA family transcriptional regulator, biotin operon repressor / biotin---[acetyl-CoA-carboxylase] ligase
MTKNSQPGPQPLPPPAHLRAVAPFDLRAVEQAIAGTEFAGSLMHLPTVGSTNDLALAAAQAGARHGVWIADEQTAGRGRGSHAWLSSRGDGLYLSALIAPPIPMQSALRLSLQTAIAVQLAVASVTGFRVRDQIDIRWPNDLLLRGGDGSARKCGGILIETCAQPAQLSGPAMLRHAVIGIGINCNHTSFPPELEAIATSLRRELPDPTQPLAREPLAAAILVALDLEIRRMVRSWRGANHHPDRDVSQFSSWVSGRRVRVDTGDPVCGSYTGVTAGLDPSGFLVVAGDDGQLHTVLSGGLREP